MNSKFVLGFVVASLSVWLGAELTGGASAAEPKTPAPRKPAAPAPAKPQVPAQPLNAIATAAANQGVKSCLGRIDQVTRFISTNATIGAFLFNAPDNADKHVYSTSMEVHVADTLGYATATFAPVGGSGCGAVYDAVTFWPSDCGHTAQTTFAHMKPAGLVKEDIQILEGGPSIRVFLMPAGQGCVAIKKEVVF
jgi:hypothetical protein